MSGSYDGPGRYEVTLYYRGSQTVTVDALSREDAARRAEANAGDDFVESDLEDVGCIWCVEPLTLKDVPGFDFSDLTGLEEAVWMVTGKVPDEAIERLMAAASEEAIA